MSRTKAMRIGAVSYLNTKPLVYGLSARLPQAELVYDLPSRLADRLAAGELDVALIPSVEFFAEPRLLHRFRRLHRLPRARVERETFSHVAGEQIRTLALDEGSRTSAALVQILLRERFGIEPQLSMLPIGASIPGIATPLRVAANHVESCVNRLAATRSGVVESQTSSPSLPDATLLIGDRAIHAPPGHWNFTWDLGDEWNRWAELPFVFAMWTARSGLDPSHLGVVDAALREARDEGLAHLPEIAEREAPQVRLSSDECLAYLRDNLYFYLGPREQRGLSLFYRQATALGLAPPGRAWREVESTAA